MGLHCDNDHIEATLRHMKVLRRYYHILWEVRGTFIGGLVAGLIYGVTSGFGLPTMAEKVFPLLFQDRDNMRKVPQWLVDFTAHQLDGSTELLTIIVCCFIPAMFLLRAISGFLNTYLINKTGYAVLERIRVRAFEKLQRLPMSYYQSQQSGDLLSRLTYDAEVLRTAIASSSNDLIKQPTTLIAAVSYLVAQSLQKNNLAFAMIGLATVPLCVLPIARAGKRISRRSREVQRQMGDSTSTINETLQSPLEIRVYQLEQRQLQSFQQQTTRVLRSMLKVIKYKNMISPSIEVVASAGIAFALYLGVKNHMSLADFLAVGMALYLAYEPIKKLGAIHATLRQGTAAAERIESIMLAEETVGEPSNPRGKGRIAGDIEWNEVSFAYTQQPVLKRISLRIRPGEMIALAGPSGSGKTTLVHMLPRLFDPQNGSIRIDGIDLREWSLRDLRAHIAVVPQMPVLFQESIMENIRMGKPSASDAEVQAAAIKAHADEFIARLPQGYHTVVGERGSSLSGGQRQRIAMARAFLKDAPILVLDEATSALDAESEAAIAQTLRQLAAGRTTLLIAHRFSTIRMAERIIVLDRGEIVGDGSFSELEQRGGVFAKLLEAANEQSETSPEMAADSHM